MDNNNNNKAGQMKVTFFDIGQAFVRGHIDANDIKDLGKVMVEKGQQGFKSLKTVENLRSIKDSLATTFALEQTLSPKSATPKSSRTAKSARSHRAGIASARNGVMGQLIGPDGNLAMEKLLGDKEDKFNLGDLPEGRRDRKRYNTRKDPWVGEVMDLLAEEVFLRNVEQPWYLAPCYEQAACQRVCFPAQFATRHKREKHGGNEEGGHSHHKGQGQDSMEESEQHFGLPDFTQAGYSLDNTDELGWPDILVPNRLGLVQAIHRKTSIQRLCLIKPKHELPPNTGPKEVRSLVRLLQKCDHANVLYLHEALEDQSHLYFMYEQYSCVTLQSVLETQWSQEDIVQIARECAAAIAFAASMNLLHLSWTLSHVLLPASRLKKPILCKVFGFGLMGVIINDTNDHICWAPECIERYHQTGPNGFLQKVEQSLKPMCDSWSLGTIVYSLVCHRPPAVSEAQAQSKKWAFTLAIDDVDPEAKSLIEGLLDAHPEKRLTASRALRHEWVRRRWRPPAGAAQVFTKIEEFCRAPLAKRLFGRFLARFLDAGHYLQIAESFGALDNQGTGTLNLKELQLAAKRAGSSPEAADVVFHWLAAAHNVKDVSLFRFAETMAEEVIDGRALRHAFESLDDDGSEQVTPQELYDELVELDNRITIADVVKHVEAAELELGEDDEDIGTQDHAIDYNEFMQLFPVRVQRMRLLKDRLQNCDDTSKELCRLLADSTPAIERWLRNIETTTLTIQDLASKVVDPRHVDTMQEAAKALKKQFAKLDEGLKAAPGPADPQEMMVKYRTGKGKSLKVFGYSSFVQDMALIDNWPMLIASEGRNMKMALSAGGTGSDSIDKWKLHEAAEQAANKIHKLLAKVRLQLEEYTSFSEVVTAPEALMAGANLSGRGLPPRMGGDEDDDEPREAMEDGLGLCCV
ncbi:unnamed protein product, partial [Effrenium voratum]